MALRLPVHKSTPFLTTIKNRIGILPAHKSTVQLLILGNINIIRCACPTLPQAGTSSLPGGAARSRRTEESQDAVELSCRAECSGCLRAGSVVTRRILSLPCSSIFRPLNLPIEGLTISRLHQARMLKLSIFAILNTELSSVRTHVSSSLTPSTEGAHQTEIEISPRISPWGDTDSSSDSQQRTGISVEKKQSHRSEEHRHHKVTLALGLSPVDQARHPNYTSQSNITVVVERKRHFSPVTDKMVDLFASGSSIVVADDRIKMSRKSTSTGSADYAPVDREDPSFPEYLYRKGTASPQDRITTNCMGSYHHL